MDKNLGRGGEPEWMPSERAVKRNELDAGATGPGPEQGGAEGDQMGPLVHHALPPGGMRQES